MVDTSSMRTHGVGSFSQQSAFKTEVALKEAQRWIEEVTGENFRVPRFKASLQDGTLLCKLVNRIKPGVVKKINTIRTTMCYLENVSFFLNACKEIGLKGSQLFDGSDLQDVPRRKEAKDGSIRGDSERTLRNVCITIYWLGKAANRISGYQGPQLDQNMFKQLIGHHALQGEGDRPVGGFHVLQREDFDEATLGRESLAVSLKDRGQDGIENGGNSVPRADETVAAVEMTAVEESSPLLQPEAVQARPRTVEDVKKADPSKRSSNLFKDIAVSVEMLKGEGKFGFSVVGGKDEGFQVKVDSVQPGLPAERAGLRPGDIVLWVNGQAVLNADHRQVVALIMECVLQRTITLGVRRTVPRQGSVSDEGTSVAKTKVQLPAGQRTSSELQTTTAAAGVEEVKVKKRYKTSRALEVHFQTKKRTRTEVTCHEEEEEQPASLQSGRSKRILYITRAELVRHFETSTRPKKEIAWLIIHAGGLFSPAPVPVQVTTTTVERQKPEVVTAVQRVAPTRAEVVIEGAPVVMSEVVRKEVPLESVSRDDRKRKQNRKSSSSSKSDSDGEEKETKGKREAREGSSSSSSSSDAGNIPLAKKVAVAEPVKGRQFALAEPMRLYASTDHKGGRNWETEMAGVEGVERGVEGMASATRHTTTLTMDWGDDQTAGDDGDKMDEDDRPVSRDDDDDDDEVVLQGMTMAAPASSHVTRRHEMDFDTDEMAPVEEIHESIKLESVVESTPDWDNFDQMEVGETTTTTTTTTMTGPSGGKSVYVSEGEFEELNTTIVNVHERSSLRMHWQSQTKFAGLPAPAEVPRETVVLAGTAAIVETAQVTHARPRLDGDESWMTEEGGGSFAVSGEGDLEEEETSMSPKFHTQLDEAVPAIAVNATSPVTRTVVELSEKPSPKPRPRPRTKPRVHLTGDEEWENDEGESSFAMTGDMGSDEHEVEGRRRQRPVEVAATMVTVTAVESAPPQRLEASEAERQRYSLTEEEKLRSKQEIESIWASLSGPRDGRSNSPSPEKIAEMAKQEAVVTEEAEPEVATSPVVRPAVRHTSSAWDDESEGSAGKMKRFEGVEPLLASLAHIKSKYGGEATEEVDFSFLEQYIARPEFSSAMKVHNRVIEVSNEEGPKPVTGAARPLLDETQKEVTNVRTTEANELAAILLDPHFQGVCYAHDRVANRDFAPPTPVLEGVEGGLIGSPVPVKERQVVMEVVKPVESAPSPDLISPWGKEPIRIVHIPRKGTDPIGLTVRTDDDGNVFVSRVLRNSKADRKGEIKEGDEILNINTTPVHGKSVDDVATLMKSKPGPVDLGLKPGDEEDFPKVDGEVFVKAHFDYNPSDDPYLPCQELGLSFKTGDILRVVNQTDAMWWQALPIKDTGREFAGLIPGKEMQEKKDTLKPKMSPDDDNELDKKKKKRGSCVPKKKKKRRHLYRPQAVGYVNDDDDVTPYEQVVKVNPDPRRKRPIILIGPTGIGRRSVIHHLLSLDDQKFATVLPETSRQIKPGEKDGDTYNFVPKEKMERDFKNNHYIELGELNGHYYGTRLDSIRTVAQSGRVCLLALHQKALKMLKQSDLKPYIIFVRPGDHAPTPSSPAHTNGHSANSMSSDEKLKQQQNEARYIDAHFGHGIDETIVIRDVGGAGKEIMRIVNRLATEPQWIYAAWDR
eukprot:m.5379 g.5379  ORF g.5379 m.5379 type:complete len:1656 (+) comp13020_c0_seq1:143-5110(+)